MSYNSRRARQSKIPPPAEITREAATVLAAVTDGHCPACGMMGLNLAPKHGQYCRTLRDSIKWRLSQQAHAHARCL